MHRWTSATHTEPLQAALMAGEFAAHLRNGDVSWQKRPDLTPGALATPISGAR